MLYSNSDHNMFVRRIRLSILWMIVALILTSMLAFYAVWQIGQLSRVTINDHAQDRLLVQELRLELEQAASLDRAFFLTGDPGLVEQYLDVEDQFIEHAETLRARITSPEGARLLQSALTRKREHSQRVKRALHLKANNASFDELARFFESEVQPKTQELQALLSALLAHKTALLDEAGKATMGAADIGRRVLLVLALANVGFCIGASWTTRSTLGALERYSADLVQSVRARDEFLAIASHELRTPVAIIKLQTQMLKRRLAGDAAIGGNAYLRSFADQVDRATNSLSTLLTRMLDTANISKGNLLLQKEEVDLYELTREVSAQLEPVFAEVGGIIYLQSGRPVVGRWDKARLEQVVTNLLMNVARHAPGQPANAVVTTEAGKARLVVEDSGPGVAKEDQVRIFERFERVRSSTDGSGMGLGLAVGKEIARSHGGNLWIESEPGKGARFILELPLTTES